MTAILMACLAMQAAQQQGTERVRIRVADAPKDIVALVKKHFPAGAVVQAERRERTDRVEFRLQILLPDRVVNADFNLQADTGLTGSIDDRPWKDEVPAAVAEAFVKAGGPAAELGRTRHTVRFDMTNPEGQGSYRWSLLEPRRQLEISADGTSVRVSERVAEADVPGAVRDSILRDYPGIRLRSIDRVTKDGAVSYEMGLRNGETLVATPEGKLTVRKP
jgi:hypothetical protein